ncbi:hypothetical protein DL96DRAFT_1817608 [Flagelloscypha sp. PMI_526]|nr:hypothetical protein DL96DRAFT_1817608 [Flagelloscypha sp. PMI_526]
MSSVASAAAKAASIAPSLRQFTFFNVHSVKDTNNPETGPEIFKLTSELSTICSSSVGVVVADLHGSLHVLNRDFEPYLSWIAHVNGRVTHMAERHGKLVTLGEEDTVKQPLLKIWDLEKPDKVTASPTLLRSVKVQTKDTTRPFPVSTISLASDLQALAIGMTDGTVLLYKYLSQSLQSPSHSLTALQKPTAILHDAQPGEPITGLGFREPSSAVVSDEDHDPHNAHLYLFIVTISQVMTYQVTGVKSSSSNNRAVTVDELGSALRCSEMDMWRNKDMVVAREEAIYKMGVDGRGTCVAYEGKKTAIHTHANYLVIISPPLQATAASTSATVRNFVARTFASGPSQDTDVTKITILDLENKLVAYTGAFNQGVREIVSQWDKLWVIGNDGSLSCLDELPTSQKLELLYEKGQYRIALSLARTQRLEESHVADIHKHYADSLYSTGKYDLSMTEFVLTIGHLQPSYVIRKFLDAQRIHNLVTYLQELHNYGLANSDHTTLLLNTYTKLKDVTRLDSFIKTEARRSTALLAINRMQGGDQEKEDLPFDLDTAIRVCRQAGYFDHAGWLAKKYHRHSEYLRILVEDAGKYAEALAYIRKLGVDAAESNLARYGRAMLAHLPGETTQLLIDLCTTTTGTLPPQPKDLPKQPPPAAPNGAPSYLSYLAIKNPIAITPAISSAAAVATPPDSRPDTPSPPPAPSSTSDVTQDQTDSSIPNQQSGLDQDAKTLRVGTPTTARPFALPPAKQISPRVYFAHFVDHMQQFVIFLEAVAWRRWGQSVDETLLSKGPPPSAVPALDEEAEKKEQVAVWNTLLDLYLTLSEDDQADSTLRAKALRILRSAEIPYDSTHALILCSTRNHTEGLVLLWGKLGMYEDIIRFYIARDVEDQDPTGAPKAVEFLKLYGPKEGQKHLYPLVLRHLTSSAELLSRMQEEVKEILDYVDREKIIPPLGIIQVLSRNNVASVGLVKEWLIEKIKTSRADITTDQEWIAANRLDTETKQKQVAALSDPDRPQQIHMTRCSGCQAPLTLPVVHFMCHHSFHADHVPPNEPDCPLCASEHGLIQEMKRNNEWLADQHELFLGEVKQGGGFETIANAFGRGMLGIPKEQSATPS